MKQASLTEVRNRAQRYFDMVESGEKVRALATANRADIVPIAVGLPYWKRRIVQPLVLPGVSVSRVILAERADG